MSDIKNKIESMQSETERMIAELENAPKVDAEQLQKWIELRNEINIFIQKNEENLCRPSIMLSFKEGEIPEITIL